MMLSNELWEAQSLIADMVGADTNKVVRNKLVQLKKKAPNSEVELFDQLWEAYIVKSLSSV